MQGSVIEPLLFLIPVNDITDNLLSIARPCADDTSLSFTACNAKDIEGTLNHDSRFLSVCAKQ